MTTLISIDTGGTLTDAIAVRDAKFFRAKALTTPHDLTKCFLESISELSREIYGREELGKLLAEAEIIRYSTTQGTNALVQGRDKGPRIGLLTNSLADPAGFQESDKENELFAALVGARVAQVETDDDDERYGDDIIRATNELLTAGANRIVVAFEGPDFADAEKRLQRIFLRKFPRHFLGALPLLLSSEMSGEETGRRRFWTSALNSFLHPTMEHFLYNAENELRKHKLRKPLMIFRNDGNSSRVAKTVALKTYSSGPRGGMEGAREYAALYDLDKVITMDIGGTTTDIGVATPDSIREMRHGLVEGIEVSFPLCDNFSVGIGGSSIISCHQGAIAVGPESVGAAPGPACFNRGGDQATITDAYLLMGYFDPQTFFGGNLKIDPAPAETVISDRIAKPLGKEIDAAVLAMDEAFHQAIAREMKATAGNVSGDVLLAFGGAGAMSACKVADLLGMRTVIIPSASPVFCALGLGFSDVALSVEKPVNGDAQTSLQEAIAQASREIFSEGFDVAECDVAKALVWEDETGENRVPINGSLPQMQDGADARIRVDVIKRLSRFPMKKPTGEHAGAPTPIGQRICLQGDATRSDLPVYDPSTMPPGTGADGPALIEDAYSTCRVLAGWSFRISENNDIVLTRKQGQSQ